MNNNTTRAVIPSPIQTKNNKRKRVLQFLTLIEAQKIMLHEKKIKKFIGPYNANCSPYYKTNFDESTKKFCSDENNKCFVTDEKVCKVIILGDVCVGKTAIVNRFCHKSFDSAYKATIGVDFEVQKFQIFGLPFNFQIWDTAGQERFKCIAQSYYRNAHAIVLVFDLTNLSSLSNCEKWLKDALNVCQNRNPYIFLVGSKTDLLNSHTLNNMESTWKMASKSIDAEFWPVSSKIGENIDSLFSRIAVLLFDDFIKEILATPKIVKVGDSDLISFKKHLAKKKKTDNCSFKHCTQK